MVVLCSNAASETETLTHGELSVHAVLASADLNQLTHSWGSGNLYRWEIARIASMRDYALEERQSQLHHT